MGVSGDEFRESAEKSVTPELPANRELREGEWLVGGHGYEIVSPGDGTPYITAVRGKHPLSLAGEAESYKPLLSHTHLFLAFARLAGDGKLDEEYDTERNARVAREWADENGVLGLTPLDRPGLHTMQLNDPWGGPRDTVAAFAEEAWLAWTVLRLYEAATDPEGVDTKTIASIRHSRYSPGRTEPERLEEWAKGMVEHWISRKLATHCYPAPHTKDDGPREMAWGFRSLLGALWLQMAFVWQRPDAEVRRCRWCRRVIPPGAAPQTRYCPGSTGGKSTCRVYDMRRRNRKGPAGRSRGSKNAG